MIAAPLKKDFAAWLLSLVLPKRAARSAFKKVEPNVNLPVGSLLAQNTANYQIPNSTVKKLEMQKRNKIITVQTEDGKHAFMITKWEFDEREAIAEHLHKIFGDRFVPAA